MTETSPAEASFLARFTVLKGAVRELWIVFACKALAFAAYGLVNSTLVLWLSSDLGLSDVKAGVVVASWSTVMTFCTVMVGSLVDSVGIRRAFLLGLALCVASRGVMSFSLSLWPVLLLGLMPLAAGEALQTPVLVAAVKRFATTRQRSMAFSVYYAMMNVGFALAGWTFDKVRSALGEYGGCRLPLFGGRLSTYQAIILLGCLCTIPNLLIVCFGLRPGIEVTDEGVVVKPEQSKYPGEPMFRKIWLSCRDALKDWGRIFSGLWSQPAFYRFLIFLSMAVGVRLIIYHMYYTFPKFAIRELGQGAPVGRLFLVINPVLIVILAPVIGALTQKVSAYRAVVVGSFIAAASVFLMAMPPAIFKPLADGWLGELIARRWLGVKDAAVNPYYVSIALMAVVYSIGEAIWSPRLYEYPAAIAPKGQEASYMSLSMLPYFIAKFFAGGLSGALLQAYCPAQGPRNSGMMWLVIGLMAMATPAGLLLFRRQIRVREAGRAE